MKKENEDNKELLSFMKEAIPGEVEENRTTQKPTKQPDCITTEGSLSKKKKKTLNNQMGSEGEEVKAQTILEINKEHPIAQKLKDLYSTDKELLKNYTKILYSQARLIEGLTVKNPTEISNIICDLISK